jgi:unsaturated chondroitin disaccharide hydrolase
MFLMLMSSRHIAYRQALDFAERQVEHLITRYPDFFPMYTVGGRWHHEGETWTHWTDGFLGGMMWQFVLRHRAEAQRSQGAAATEAQQRVQAWQPRAEHYSRLLAPRQFDRSVHDLGFIFLSTYLPWYELSGEETLRQVLIQAGRTLALRFRERGQYLHSFIGPQSLFIDIMMNVPLIFYAALQSGDGQLARIATAHCCTTRDTLVRADGSTAHEGIFDLETGRFLRQDTHQGLAPDSAWARGLAWSLYGYSKCYALTGQTEFLEVAERNAAYWIAHLPEDGIPYWDFHADPQQPPPWGAQKESSAAAIAASGLWDLAQLTANPSAQTRYRQTALRMLDVLAAPPYLACDTPGWEGILRHGVYHTRKNLGVDESVMWGDYFFVEALTKVVAESVQRLDPAAVAQNRQRYEALQVKAS